MATDRKTTKQQPATFFIEKVDGGYTAYAEALSILTEADTLQEIYTNAREALAEQCEETGENPADFDVRFRLDIPAFFDQYPINISALAPRLGINNTLISQYISGKKTPGPKQRKKIEDGIHELAREMAALSFG